MKLTRSGEYGINGLLYFARREKGRIAYVSEVSEELDISGSFLAKIFQAMARAGILNSHRGVSGGYSLARAPQRITLKEVIEATQGPIALNRCLLGRKRPCGRHRRCGLHSVLKDTQQKIKEQLEKTTLSYLAETTQFSSWRR